jgi:hypothetical protein
LKERLYKHNIKGRVPLVTRYKDIGIATMSRNSGVHNPGPLRQCDALQDEENLILDDLEQTTGRLYHHANNLKDESHMHNRLLEGLTTLFFWVCFLLYLQYFWNE